jgi:hypothetical protein
MKSLVRTVTITAAVAIAVLSFSLTNAFAMNRLDMPINCLISSIDSEDTVFKLHRNCENKAEGDQGELLKISADIKALSREDKATLGQICTLVLKENNNAGRSVGNALNELFYPTTHIQDSEPLMGYYWGLGKAGDLETIKDAQAQIESALTYLLRSTRIGHLSWSQTLRTVRAELIDAETRLQNAGLVQEPQRAAILRDLSLADSGLQQVLDNAGYIDIDTGLNSIGGDTCPAAVKIQ